MNFVSAQGVKFILVYFPIKNKVVRVDFRLFELMALANREKQRHFVLVFYSAWCLKVSSFHNRFSRYVHPLSHLLCHPYFYTFHK